MSVSKLWLAGLILVFFPISLLAQETNISEEDWLVLSRSDNLDGLRLYLVQETKTKQCFVLAATQSFKDGSGYQDIASASCGNPSKNGWKVVSRGEAPYPVILVRETRAEQCFVVALRGYGGPVAISVAKCDKN